MLKRLVPATLVLGAFGASLVLETAPHPAPGHRCGVIVGGASAQGLARDRSGYSVAFVGPAAYDGAAAGPFELLDVEPRHDDDGERAPSTSSPPRPPSWISVPGAYLT